MDNSNMDGQNGPGRAEKGGYLEVHLPPSFSRQPPDGHEFPTHYEETVRDWVTATEPAAAEQRKPTHSTKSAKPSSNLEQTLKRISTSYVDNYKHRGWRNDEKSEKSVKDKIAMFSSANGDDARPPQPPAPRKLNRYRSSDDVNGQNDTASNSLFCGSDAAKVEGSKLNIGKKGSLPYTSLVDVSEGGPDSNAESRIREKTRSTLDLSSATRFPYETGRSTDEYATLPRNYDGGRKLGREDSDPASFSRVLGFAGPPKIHGRSQSLIDVAIRPDRALGRSIEDARKSSLNALIEQRRKSMSKLRGLVIPEKVAEVPAPQYILDLPEIKSKDCWISSAIGGSGEKNGGGGPGEDSAGKTVGPAELGPPIATPPWKAQPEPSELPKYSPAFKRRSLSLYGVSSSVSSVSSSLSSSREELRNCFNESSKPFLATRTTAKAYPVTSPRNRPEPKSLESITSISMSEASFDSGSNESPESKISPDKYKGYEESPFRKIDADARVTEEESDNDSAVSSSRSSISHGFSPPNSPMAEVRRSDKGGAGGRTLKRTLSSETTASTASSNGSTLTSGSQASCSSLGSSSSADSRRVLKPQSVEAINRKNVLSSARYSSGQDLKVGSPPMRTIRPDTVPTDDDADTTNDNSESYSENEPSVSPDPGKREEYGEPSSPEVAAGSHPRDKIRDEKDKTKDVTNNNDRDNHRVNYDQCKYDDVHGSPTEIVESFRADSAVSGKIEISRPNDWDSGDCTNNNLKTPTTKKGEMKNSGSAKSRSPQKTVCVNDIKKAFEKVEQGSNGRPRNSAVPVYHPRVSSIDSTNSDESLATTPTHYGSASDLLKEQQFGSITSLASSTSLISQQELSQLIEDSNHALEESGCSQEVVVVILHRDTAGSSVGIILAGGVDCEAKEITVHKVLNGSPAEKDGRIQKGDRIISINGRSMKGLTHHESLAILKAPRAEVVLVVSRYRMETTEDIVTRITGPQRQPRIPENKIIQPSTEKGSEARWGSITTVVLTKDGAGLGFSLEGGKDSPFGDQPLTIKKIFTGGCAEKCGQVYAGDELLSVNNTDLSGLSRIEAWALMKRLPDGKVQLSIRHPVA